MERESTAALNPAALPADTLVGPWRVVGWAGRGVHSAVYRAVRSDKPHSPPVALKLALLPRDPRFAREKELLSRMRQPNVPRLWDSGAWQSPSGAIHPYLAIDWVDGMPLYDWARQHAPTVSQQLRVLAQLARALQELHAHGGVHRDVKGDNVLVRSTDSRAFLTDFGAGSYEGATTLTPPDTYPGTPAYRAPEAGLFELNSLRNRSARYRARPADDVYALGVTACRLVTGEYPEFGEPTQDEHGTWHMAAVVVPTSLQHVDSRLRELILRMLSVRPEDRGTAAQLAEALEQAVESLQPGGTKTRLGDTPLARPRRTWALAAAASLALVAAMGWSASRWLEETLLFAHWQPARAEQPDAGPTGLGEALASASQPSSHELHAPQGMEEDTLPEPLPGQEVPDSKGRCPRKRQVALNGGCWVEFQISAEECEEKDGYFFKQKCYLALIPRGRRPTSSPAAPEPNPSQ